MKTQRAAELQPLQRADRVVALVEEGLQLYRRHRSGEAFARFRLAASLDPEESASSGVKEHRREAGTSGMRLAVKAPSAEGAGVDRALLVILLQAKRFHEALVLLQEAAQREPGDDAIRRGIEAIREHVVQRFVRQVGGLDCVFVKAPGLDPALARSPFLGPLLAMVDGHTSLAEILADERHGRFEAARALMALMRQGALGVGSKEAATTMQAPVTERSGRAPAAAPAISEEAHAELHRRGTEAYLARDYETALRIYEECLGECPDDARAAHNAAWLRQHLGR
jgi:tetratricopeptide (TPR) repeat protein